MELLRDAELTPRERHRLLNTDRCRIALDVLTERSTPLKLETLTMEVALSEEDIDSTDEDAISRLAVSLRYDHLPRMAELGILDYDSEANLIQLGERGYSHERQHRGSDQYGRQLGESRGYTERTIDRSS